MPERPAPEAAAPPDDDDDEEELPETYGHKDPLATFQQALKNAGFSDAAVEKVLKAIIGEFWILDTERVDRLVAAMVKWMVENVTKSKDPYTVPEVMMALTLVSQNILASVRKKQKVDDVAALFQKAAENIQTSRRKSKGEPGPDIYS